MLLSTIKMDELIFGKTILCARFMKQNPHVVSGPFHKEWARKIPSPFLAISFWYNHNIIFPFLNRLFFFFFSFMSRDGMFISSMFATLS